MPRVSTVMSYDAKQVSDAKLYPEERVRWHVHTVIDPAEKYNRVRFFASFLLQHGITNPKVQGGCSGILRNNMATSYNGPHAAELALAFEIAAEAGRMITNASAKRWQQSSNEASGTAGSSEPGTKKNSVDVSHSLRALYVLRCLGVSSLR